MAAPTGRGKAGKILQKSSNQARQYYQYAVDAENEKNKYENLRNRAINSLKFNIRKRIKQKIEIDAKRENYALIELGYNETIKIKDNAIFEANSRIGQLKASKEALREKYEANIRENENIYKRALFNSKKHIGNLRKINTAIHFKFKLMSTAIYILSMFSMSQILGLML